MRMIKLSLPLLIALVIFGCVPEAEIDCSKEANAYENACLNQNKTSDDKPNTNPAPNPDFGNVSRFASERFIPCMPDRPITGIGHKDIRGLGGNNFGNAYDSKRNVIFASQGYQGILAYDLRDLEYSRRCGDSLKGRITYQGGARDLLLHKDHLYSAAEENGLVTIDTRSLTNMVVTSQIVFPEEHTWQLASHNNHLYVGSEKALTVYNLDNPSLPRQVFRKLSADIYLNGMIKDLSISNERLFVLNENKTVIFNITNPSTPIHMATLDHGRFNTITNYRLGMEFSVNNKTLAVINNQNEVEFFNIRSPQQINAPKILEFDSSVLRPKSVQLEPDKDVAHIVLENINSGVNIFRSYNISDLNVIRPYQSIGIGENTYVWQTQMMDGKIFIAKHSFGIKVLDVSDGAANIIFERSYATWVRKSLSYNDYLFVHSTSRGLMLYDYSNLRAPRLIYHHKDEDGSIIQIDHMDNDDNVLLFSVIGSDNLYKLTLGRFSNTVNVETIIDTSLADYRLDTFVFNNGRVLMEHRRSDLLTSFSLTGTTLNLLMSTPFQISYSRMNRIDDYLAIEVEDSDNREHIKGLDISSDTPMETISVDVTDKRVYRFYFDGIFLYLSLGDQIEIYNSLNPSDPPYILALANDNWAVQNEVGIDRHHHMVFALSNFGTSKIFHLNVDSSNTITGHSEVVSNGNFLTNIIDIHSNNGRTYVSKQYGGLSLFTYNNGQNLLTSENPNSSATNIQN